MTFGEDFLQDPAGLPADRAGDPWGDERLILANAGGPHLVSGLSSPQARALSAHFGPGIADVAGTDPGAEVRLFRLPRRAFRERAYSGWVYSLDMAHEPASVSFAGLYLVGRLSLGERIAASLFTCHEDGPWFLPVFENFFRVLASYRFLDRGGVLLHSAAVVEGAAADIFFGPSRAGKTTVSRLALGSGRSVLSDDLNGILRDGPRYLVERLPFAGELGQAACASERFPLRSLFRLRKGSASCLRRMGAAEALAALLGCAPYVNQDPCRSERLASNIEAIIESVPVRELTFSRAGGFWDMLNLDGRGP